MSQAVVRYVPTFRPNTPASKVYLDGIHLLFGVEAQTPNFIPTLGIYSTGAVSFFCSHLYHWRFWGERSRQGSPDYHRSLYANLIFHTAAVASTYQKLKGDLPNFFLQEILHKPSD